MLTLGFHNPFAVLGKESPKPETRASAQGASYPGVLRRALSPKSPPRSRRGDVRRRDDVGGGASIHLFITPAV